MRARERAALCVPSAVARAEARAEASGYEGQKQEQKQMISFQRRLRAGAFWAKNDTRRASSLLSARPFSLSEHPSGAVTVHASSSAILGSVVLF